MSSYCLPGPKKIFFFLVARQAPSFIFTHFLLLSQYTSPFCPFAFSSVLLSSSSLPSFPSYPLLSVFLLFPFFLPGTFELFSYLPGSAATTLLRLFEPCCLPSMSFSCLPIIGRIIAHSWTKWADKYLLIALVPHEKSIN